MATKLPPPPASNGVITAPPKGVVGGNRKKQKRRAKQAAKAATLPASGTEPQPDLDEYDGDPLGYGEEDDYEFSDAEQYRDSFAHPHSSLNGYDVPSSTPAGRKQKKKARAGELHSRHHHHSAYAAELIDNGLSPLSMAPPPVIGGLRADVKGAHGDIWNTSTQQERQNIKDFWLSLSEDERKSLLKIEKEAVLRKMKQQQKHSCSCTVCGRKRTAIEEELEVLYEGYYEELEQYAHHDQPPNLAGDSMMPDPLHHRRPPLELPPPPADPQHRASHIHEHIDDDDDEDDDFSDEEEYSDDEDYCSDELSSPAHARSAVPDFFTFGQNLTVKGILTPWLEKLQSGLKGRADNILTVADDLLKNDGRKFIEMMEQLAERRMQRENEAEYAATNASHPGGYAPSDPAYAHDDPLAAGDDYEDDEGSYDSQEEYDEEVDEDDEMVSSADAHGDSHKRLDAKSSQSGLTQEQRMQEGRRMFQIFAARMFEQRVLTAYKEKVAAERQQKLLEELEDETKLEAQREAKKQRDAQKKKDKKKQQQAAKAEEKAKKDAEKAAEEARLREAEEKKQEEQRRRKEEQRKKKEEEKRRQEEERMRKEGEKTRRQQEEQQRREEAERKARDQKIAEKARKDEARKREREEREARELKASEDREKKEREAKPKTDRERTSQPAAHPQQPAPASKRPTQPGIVAVPGQLPRQTSSAVPSPHLTVATPVVPKATTPAVARQRQASQQGSHASSPKQAQSQVSSAPSKSSSPGSAAALPSHQNPFAAGPMKIMQKAGNQQPVALPAPSQHGSTPPTQSAVQPPPGMPHPQQQAGAFQLPPPVGFGGYVGAHGAASQGHPHGHVAVRSPAPMYTQQPQPVSMQSRFGPPGIGGSQSALAQTARPGYVFDNSAQGALPPGFGHGAQAQSHAPSQPPPQQAQQHHRQHHPPPQMPYPQTPSQPQAFVQASGASVSAIEAPRPMAPAHSRQPSGGAGERYEIGGGHAIARPAPIQRPSSVKPQGAAEGDVDDLSRHLGSSALLDDTDEPMPPSMAENRRQSSIAPGVRPSIPGMGGLGGFGTSTGFGGAPASWGTPSLPFSPGSGLGQQSWGSLPAPGTSWSNSGGSFGANGAFGSIGGSQMHRPSVTGVNRPLTIRLAVCQACKQLTMVNRGDGDGFHDINLLLRQIEANRVPLDSPPSLREIEDICETEGDAQNGGGELHVRRGPGRAPNTFAVMWQPLAGTPDQARGIGEIGSPLPIKASPAGFGAPGLGRALGSGFQHLGGSMGPPSGSGLL